MPDPEILFIIGTRPELIKMAPVILELKARGFKNYKIVNTEQHKDLLKIYWEIFGLQADYELDVISPNQSLSSLTGKSIEAIQNLLDGFGMLKDKVKIVIAQGDTTTVMAASIVSFYNKIKFVHLEAGLRSNDLQNPFPEEFNRKVASINTYLHLAPTEQAKKNLLHEGIDESKVKVVGNTVVDSLEFIKKTDEFLNNKFIKKLYSENTSKRYVLITCHRRENHGENLTEIISAIVKLAALYPNIIFIWTLHPNPNIKTIVKGSVLNKIDNVKLIPPLEYADLLALMSHCTAIITDSGGLQEEAPSFKVPVLVLREVTERPEAVNLGFSFLVGTNKEAIVNSFSKVVEEKCKTKYFNPYGDGNSAKKIANLLLLES